MTKATRNTIVAGVFVVLAAAIGAFINTYKFSPTPTPERVFITGIVVERDSNQPIGQALVVVVGRAEQSTSRDNGNFRLALSTDSPPVVTLRITKAGYRPAEMDVHAPADNVTFQMQRQ
jgi:hypothetical protein